MPGKKLAIIISGAVSLGSYEAGVVYEIINAIGQHNRKADEDGRPDDKILIDVITGASAGGMTAAILAQKLLFEGDKLDGPKDNELYRAWVEEVDIQGLLDETYRDDPLASLLSSNRVKEIAADLLLSRYRSPHEQQPHPACAKHLRLGLSMSNLNGLDFSIKLSSADSLGGKASPGQDEDRHFHYTRHQDKFVRNIDRSCDQEDFWKEIADAACACGAFPYAFRPLDVERNTRKEDEWMQQAGNVGKEPVTFTYTDGGTFQNEPLGMAKGLVDEADPMHLAYDERYYLYVSPNPKSAKLNHDFKEDGATMAGTTKVLLSAIFNQARCQDWITMRNINLRIDLFDQQAKQLSELLADHPEQAVHFSAVTNLLLGALYAEDTDARTRDRTRLKEQFKDVYPTVPEPLRELWLETVQVLEKAAGIGGKDLMTVYSITVDENETASEHLAAFSGFMARNFREHDYHLGRYKAQKFLTTLQQAILGGDTKNMPLRDFTLDRIDKPEPDLSQAPVSEIDETVRQQVLARAMKRLKQAVNAAIPKWWQRLAAKLAIKFVIKNKIKCCLELKPGCSCEKRQTS